MNDNIIGWGMIAGFGELGYEGYTWLVDGKSQINTLCSTLNLLCYGSPTEWVGLNKILLFLGDISIAFIIFGIVLIAFANESNNN